jgi:hypothetical protein
LHINPLEFLAIIIEVWFCLAFIHRADPYGHRDWIVLIRADNTSALSWLRRAGCCRRPVVRRLAFFLHALLTSHSSRLSLQDLHISGKENYGADALSRPSRAHSVESAIAQSGSMLQGLSHYQVPLELLSTLREVVTSNSNEVFTVERMTKLLTLELSFFSSG